MIKSRCAVVIPAYKERLTVFEHESLMQTCAVLGKNHDLFYVCPESLVFSGDYYNEVHIEPVRFDDGYFKSTRTYSELCELPGFYDTFIKKGYEYMLICQLDAWVFSDKLDYFMDFGYDYYGGPHYHIGPWNGLHNGNGGLSLRKLNVFRKICEVADFSNCSPDEDVAFSHDLQEMMHKAPVDLCLTFSLQHAPVHYEYLLDRNNLPMGTHQPYNSCIWCSVWSKYINVDINKAHLPYK